MRKVIIFSVIIFSLLTGISFGQIIDTTGVKTTNNIGTGYSTVNKEIKNNSTPNDTTKASVITAPYISTCSPLWEDTLSTTKEIIVATIDNGDRISWKNGEVWTSLKLIGVDCPFVQSKYVKANQTGGVEAKKYLKELIFLKAIMVQL